MILVNLDQTFDVDYKLMVREKKKRMYKRRSRNAEEGSATATAPGEDGEASNPMTPSSTSKSQEGNDDDDKSPITRT